MYHEIPTITEFLFGATVLLSMAWFYLASRSRAFLIFSLAWIALQTGLGLNEVYTDTEAMPPKLMVIGVFPMLLVIVALFATKGGRRFLRSIDLKQLTAFHTIRLPVEIVLALLFGQGLVSEYMTWHGTNFDVFSGATALLVAALAFRNQQVNRSLLLGWNVLCLLLLLNVVITAVFALPSPMQKLAFDQPNVAVMYFPFNLLPAYVVPLVFLGHLAAIWRLLASHQIES